MTELIEDKLHEISLTYQDTSHTIVVDPAVYYFLKNKTTLNYDNLVSEKYPNKKGYQFVYSGSSYIWYTEENIANTLESDYTLEVLSTSDLEVL